MNPLDLVQMIRNGQNPQQLVMSILQQNANSNPFNANLLNLAKTQNTAEIEQIVRNVAAQKGVDYDKEFTAFKKLLGL